VISFFWGWQAGLAWGEHNHFDGNSDSYFRKPIVFGRSGQSGKASSKK